jgi:digalactosyldiacylglycerol synthase
MTKGRNDAGGSVTLMLPWLERRQDQERVYGQDQVFESTEAQENYIRKWLQESAGMPQASEDLKIAWYTAWQNKIENSVYSMGDITAEPEHLNWYRAPGESWTDKFKHVVGIIHTNYFVYAQEQPAAFIRVRTTKRIK